MKLGKLLIMTVCGALLLLAGCFQGEQSLNEMDPPEDAEAVSDTEVDESGEDISEESDDEIIEEEKDEVVGAETVARELYLIDADGMVASQTLELPELESKEVATQLLEYLVVDGPITEVLPNGFRAVIPAGTEVLGVNVQDDGIMVVDLSEEFTSYQADDELKIIESMTHTLTQFENVEKIQLRVEGHSLEEMPVNGTPIAEGYTRANGINLTSTDTLDYVNSQAVTMYYPANQNENRYYVPVTQHVEMTDDDLYKTVVQELIEGSTHNQHVTHVFNSGVVLEEEPTFQDGILELVFNEAILEYETEDIISDEVMETLVRTLTNQDSIEAVNVKVENKDKLVSESGEVYETPVTSDYFIPSESL